MFVCLFVRSFVCLFVCLFKGSGLRIVAVLDHQHLVLHGAEADLLHAAGLAWECGKRDLCMHHHLLEVTFDTAKV